MPGLGDHLKQMGDRVRPGQPLSTALTAQRLNAMMDAIRALASGDNLSQGLGITLTKNGSGSVVVGSSVRGGSGTASIEHPFQIRNVSTGGETPAAKINVRYGTVQDLEPANVAVDSTLSTSGTYSVYLEVEVNLAGTIIGASVEAALTGLPADTDYFGYVLLGTAVVADSGAGKTVTQVNQAATHSLRMALCGRVVDGATLTTPGTFEFWGF